MNSSKKMPAILKELIKVLGDEKQVLIKNDAVALAGIVEKKNGLIGKIEEFKGMDFSQDEEIRGLAGQISLLQETNMLLTKQALGYQEQILKALATNNTSRYNTYSSKGQIYGQKEVSIVDQSV
jgi:PHP family Zn ribbon phosphoesterase